MMVWWDCHSGSVITHHNQQQSNSNPSVGWKSATTASETASQPVQIAKHSMMITDAQTIATGIWPLDLEGHTRNARPEEQFSRTRSGTWP